MPKLQRLLSSITDRNVLKSVCLHECIYKSWSRECSRDLIFCIDIDFILVESIQHCFWGHQKEKYTISCQMKPDTDFDMKYKIVIWSWRKAKNNCLLLDLWGVFLWTSLSFCYFSDGQDMFSSLCSLNFWDKPFISVHRKDFILDWLWNSWLCP